MSSYSSILDIFIIESNLANTVFVKYYDNKFHLIDTNKLSTNNQLMLSDKNNLGESIDILKCKSNVVVFH